MDGPPSAPTSVQSDRSREEPLHFRDHRAEDSSTSCSLSRTTGDSERDEQRPPSAPTSVQSDRSREEPLHFRDHRAEDSSTSCSLSRTTGDSERDEQRPPSAPTSVQSDRSREEPLHFRDHRAEDSSTSCSLSRTTGDSERDEQSSVEKQEQGPDSGDSVKPSESGINEQLDTELVMSHKVVKLDDLWHRGRTVLTVGVAGIGKTFHAKTYETKKKKKKKKKERVIYLDLKTLNLEESQSIEHLLKEEFSQSKKKVTVILDGLDHLSLDFEKTRTVTDVTEEASVMELMINLLRGNLLPSARLWVLSRSSGPSKISEKLVHTVTQCRETEKRRQKLISALKATSLKTFAFEENTTHPNQTNTEHIRPDRVDTNGRKQQVTTSDLFKEEGDRIRQVWTIGEAGVGKSYLVRRFLHNWATPSSSTDTRVMFPLSLPQLNNLPQSLSLVELLNKVFKEMQQCVMSDYNSLSCVFILDSVEEFQLDLSSQLTVKDQHEVASVRVLLCSLIRGDLLPSALVWITSRPEAAQDIPKDLLQRTTLIREKPDVVSQRNLKKILKKRFERVAEGVDGCKTTGAFLKDIYTNLYIIEGESSEVVQKHETEQVQQGKNYEARKEIPINYQDIFKASSGRNIKTVLTNGVAGIGKTFASMKYMLDWAEGTSTDTITFPLPFRELNLRKDEEVSLEELLHQFFPCMKTSEITDYDQYKLLIVLDGLDECRLDLNFSELHVLSDITQKATVNDIVTNLVVGNLLPKAQVWITSRPAASRRIPAEKVDKLTEVRGFSDEQKEQYFRKRFETKMAEDILRSVKESRSIYIMCYIPVFCWITAKVLESFFKTNPKGKPKTLTDLFIHFLLLQCRQANEKYNEPAEEQANIWNERNKKIILGLSKMAFEEMERGNLLFTEDDFSSYGLNVEEAAVFSGLLTTITRDSDVLPNLFYSFVHSSVQEFMAAFYVFYTFNNEGTNVLSSSASTDQSASDQSDSDQSDSDQFDSDQFDSDQSDSDQSHSDQSHSYQPASDFYKSAVDKALGSRDRDWDLFLRFLLGLSLESNCELLKEVLKTSESTDKINKETIVYIKSKINEDCDSDMNLFHCLNELNDNLLVDEIKKYLKSEKNDYETFSPYKWSALSFVLLTSDQNLELFDLKRYRSSEKVLLGMMPVVKVSAKAALSACGLSEVSCRALSDSILMSPSSNLTELDLSHNELKDAGAEALAVGLKSRNCKVKILRLVGCRLSEQGCSALVSALMSNKSSKLEILDLSYNHPGPAGERLKALEHDPINNLKEVCLAHCCAHRLKPGLRKFTADLTYDLRLKHSRIVISKQTARMPETESQRPDTESQRPDTESQRPDTESQRPDTERDRRAVVKVRHVFCEQQLRGLCYWELQWDGTVGVGVCYKGSALDCVLGHDHRSWGVFCSNQPNSCLDFAKSAEQAQISPLKNRRVCRFPSQRMAVYLDWEAGTLSFYSVMADGELHLVTTFTEDSFTEPLVPLFWLQYGSVTLCDTEGTNQ